MAGVYTVTVRDVNLCSGTGTISITQPTAGITGTITTTPTGCGNSIGSATVTASGGVPAYTYTWGPAPGSGTSISGLGVGSYSVIVADAQGCSVILNTSIRHYESSTFSYTVNTSLYKRTLFRLYQ